MNILSTSRTLALCGSIMILSACTPREEAIDNPQSTTYETIELGTTLDHARGLLAGEFTEYKVGETPDIDVIMFEDGRQLVFMDNVLTDKNTSKEIEHAMNTRKDATD